MAYRKHVLMTIVLLAISGILFGCGDSTVAPADTTEAPIVAPTNVTARELANGDIEIQWDPSTQTNLRGYNVYRLDTVNYQIGKLNGAELTQNNYVDRSAIRQVQYEYRVTAVSSKGTESTYASAFIMLNDPPIDTKDRRMTRQ
jgi:fibronectin type 3 domain-containing protein